MTSVHVGSYTKHVDAQIVQADCCEVTWPVQCLITHCRPVGTPLFGLQLVFPEEKTPKKGLTTLTMITLNTDHFQVHIQNKKNKEICRNITNYLVKMTLHLYLYHFGSFSNITQTSYLFITSEHTLNFYIPVKKKKAPSFSFSVHCSFPSFHFVMLSFASMRNCWL